MRPGVQALPSPPPSPLLLPRPPRASAPESHGRMEAASNFRLGAVGWALPTLINKPARMGTVSAAAPAPASKTFFPRFNSGSLGFSMMASILLRMPAPDTPDTHARGDSM